MNKIIIIIIRMIKKGFHELNGQFDIGEVKWKLRFHVRVLPISQSDRFLVRA